jgi:hypothetical protein
MKVSKKERKIKCKRQKELKKRKTVGKTRDREEVKESKKARKK